MKISFLIHTVYGIGGTIRTTLNLAEELAARHEVEIVSVFRHRDIPLFTIDPRITVVPLVDTRPKSPTCEKAHPDQLRSAEHFPRNEARYQEYSRLTDERVRAHYARSDADVVVGTRPGLVAYTAQFAPEGAVLIGQEHMTHHHHRAVLREEMRPHLERIDAFVTVSEGDAAVWREQMRLSGTRIVCIPNSVPEPMVVPSDRSGTTVVAAGRLSKEKRYDVLISAFAQVVKVRPEWTLRICGWGPEKARLRRHIDRLGLNNSVYLMGPRSPIEPEWAKGAIAASTSRHESFGMTLVEAMRCGVPMVSTDCDYGPREIIRDGEDGLLVPVGDVDAVAAALLRLIDDEDLRQTMGRTAVRNARRFDPSAIARRYVDLFAELGAGEPAGGAPASGGAAEGAAAGVPAAAGHGAVRDGRSGRGGAAPVVDAVAEGDGSVSVTLVPVGAARRDGLRLVCVPHAGPAKKRGAGERTYPFGNDGTATIPAGDVFAEGTWRCHVEGVEGGSRVALAVRAADQRGSLDAARRQRAGEPVRHLVPHRSPPEGLLELRAWSRDVHAEAGDVQVAGHDGVAVTGRLYGQGTGGPADGRPELLMRLQGGGPEGGRESVAPGAWLPDGRFRLVVPLHELQRREGRDRARPDVWELWMRASPGREPVRIGRVLDDVIAKGDVFTYRTVLRHRPRPLLLLRRVLRKLRGRKQLLVAITPLYDGGNALNIQVTDQ
ncbi:glycosyltransferase family 4 protein [Streptomyces sp. MUM 203J]|uniref:glycosyltransferase family 4 protein n=1 Tax=Streptomyces sp. MUM 203J TaxID=2791990 RepID=UPI001F0371D6|nr:glycosyltransferase family 4 protein [Streptomyces sp. MUM 203J]MCH0541973.1 glycosyltransferase family 4 protein [Streptomyces sp. MUM 203J]